MAEQFWRIRRWREREARIMDYDDGETGLIALTKMMPILQRLMSAAERGFHKALSALRQVQKDRGFVPHLSGSTATMTSTEAAGCELHSASSSGRGFVPRQETPPQTEAARKYSTEVEVRRAEAVECGDAADPCIYADHFPGFVSQ